MFSGSISVSNPTPAAPLVHTSSASGIPEPISLEQAEGRIHELVIPPYRSGIAEALLRGDASDVQVVLGTIGNMDKLQQHLINFSDVGVLERIASFVQYELDITLHTRESYRTVLGSENPQELNSLIPGIATIGSKFNEPEKFALYAGTLRLLGDTDAGITEAPLERSPQGRIYNALFCLPPVTDNLSDPAIMYVSLDAYLDKVQEHLGVDSLYLLSPST